MSLNLFLTGRRDEGRAVPKCCTIQRVFKSGLDIALSILGDYNISVSEKLYFFVNFRE